MNKAYGYNKWKDQFERHVKKGEHGITIIAPTPYKKKIEEQKLDPDTKAPILDKDGKIVTEEKEIEIPMFRPVKVFDVSQTDGKPLPEIASSLSGNVPNYEAFMEALRRSAPVPITFEAMAADTDGYFSADHQKIAIRQGMSEVQTVSATVHEIAHSKLHNQKKIQIANDEQYQEIELFDKLGLFSNGRIARDNLPEGVYCYDLRGSDYDPGDPVCVEERVVVNHAGSVLLTEPLELTEDGRLMLTEEKGLNFTGGFSTLSQFLQKQRKDRHTEEVEAESISYPKPHGKSYNKWLGDQAKPSHREQLRVMIDRALEQKPADFDALLKLLTEMGCEVSRRGKAIRLKAPGWKNVARMDDKLGAGYSEAEIRAVLAGEKQHTPRKNSVVQPEPTKVNLLVDIQAKLQAGKGAGYARWAKVFNLKQMAQTMNYLSENNLLEYAVLEEKAAAATAHHNDLSAQIKAAEKRMAEIAVLRTHIVNYAKTRETYVAYRKAGYSRKFREEHEEEILLHQAAKNAFDEMDVKKLPKVKELQTEYAKLLEEKKKTYAEYRRSREEMRELLTAKANVDRVLKMEVEQDVEKEKDHGQR